MISQIVAVLSIASMADARMQSFLMVKGGNSVSLKEKRAAWKKARAAALLSRITGAFNQSNSDIEERAALLGNGDNGCIRKADNNCRMTLAHLSSVNGTKEPKHKEYFINFYYPGDGRSSGKGVKFTKTAQGQHFLHPQGKATFSVEGKEWVGILVKTPGDELTSDEYYARLEYPCMDPGQDLSLILTETVYAAAEKNKQIVEEKKLIDEGKMPEDLLEQQAKRLSVLQKQAKENAIPYEDSSTPLLEDNSARLKNDDVFLRISYTCS